MARVPEMGRSGESAAHPAAHAHVLSFAPQVGAGCRVLVLGTAPRRRSLELQQSYAHLQNLFWPFLGELDDAVQEVPYAERIARLHRRGVGSWDVLESCERPGSLARTIRADSEVPNDIPALIRRYPSSTMLAVNGAKTLQAF